MFSNNVKRSNRNEIVLYLSSTQAPPKTVPFELQAQVTAAVWDVRMASIIRESARYSKVWVERIWMILAFVSIIAVPVAVQSAIYDAVIRRDSEGFLVAKSLIEAKAILFAIFVGTILLFVVPMVLWKFIGRKHLSALANKWTEADRQDLGQNMAATWRIKSPSIFRDGTVVYVGLPSGTKTSTFHPNAYLPSYLNAAQDADADYYYPYKPEPGLPRMSVVGNVPLYDEKRQLAYKKY